MFDFVQPSKRQRELVQTLTKLTMIALWLVAVVAILRRLPGIHYVIPQTPITLAAMVGAGATVVLVGVLLLIAPTAASLVGQSLSGPAEAVESVASVVHWGVVLIAIIVAHRGFAGLMAPMMGELFWVYDLTFLVLSLPPVLVIAAGLYAVVDPTAERLTDRLVRKLESADERPPDER